MLRSLLTLALLLRTTFSQTTFVHDYNADPDLLNELGPRLSDSARITTDASSAPRWSDYHAPQPAYVIHVADENDVVETVKYCNEHKLRYLAQSGGHGWANTFSLGSRGVVINLQGLNSIRFSESRTEVTVGGGTLNSDLVNAAYDHGVQVLNGGCNCVGVLGLSLGGGVSRWMNLYGMPVDNVVSANVVIASGELVTASEDSNPDLFWALLGAGPNFGIVTSAVMKSYPLLEPNGTVWTGELIFSGDKLEAVVNALNALNLTEDINVLWGFSHRPEPIIGAQVFYMRGDAEAGRRAFQTLYDIGPDQDTTGIVAYNRINDDTEGLCEDGGRKPGWFTGLKTFDYPTFQRIWDEWVDFVGRTGLTGTTILIECYSNYVLRGIGGSKTSYPHRDIEYYAFQLFDYDDPELDSIVETYGSRVRDLWRTTSGYEPQRTYINFAHGDESLEEIYGESLPRLQELKRIWDPKGRFNQWFPLL